MLAFFTLGGTVGWTVGERTRTQAPAQHSSHLALLFGKGQGQEACAASAAMPDCQETRNSIKQPSECSREPGRAQCLPESLGLLPCALLPRLEEFFPNRLSGTTGKIFAWDSLPSDTDTQ